MEELTEPSPYNKPILAVAKKDGGVRVCVYLRKFNAYIEAPDFPLPRAEYVQYLKP